MCIPSSVVYLNTQCDIIKMDYFPPNIKYLSIICFSHEFTFNHLTHLRCEYVGGNGNAEEFLEKYLPTTVTHLFLSDMGGEDAVIAYRIPSFVTHLSIASNLGPNVFFVIPSNITHLTFGYYFDRSIKGIIPESVTHLRFGNWFNSSLIDIPSCVTHVILGRYFSRNRFFPSY